MLTAYIRKGIADEQLAKLEKERGCKRERQNEDSEIGVAKRRRSASSASSVSTISTNMSRSPTPRETRRTPDAYNTRTARRSRSPQLRGARKTSDSYNSRPARSSSSPRPESSRYKRRTPSLSPSPPPREDIRDSGKKRRRDSYSSVDSYSSRGEQDIGDTRQRASSRSTRKRFNDRSPEIRGRRTQSRSPYRGRRDLSDDRTRFDEPRNKGERRDSRASIKAPAPRPPRERSLSPFSKRLALTQAMTKGR